MKYSTGDIIETLDPRKYWSIIGVHDNMYYCKKLDSTRDDEVVSFTEYQVFTGFVQAGKGVLASEPKEPATRRTNCEFCKHLCYCSENYNGWTKIKCKKFKQVTIPEGCSFVCGKFKPNKIGKQKIKENKRNEK